jgi:hypothetical protein
VVRQQVIQKEEEVNTKIMATQKKSTGRDYPLSPTPEPSKVDNTYVSTRNPRMELAAPYVKDAKESMKIAAENMASTKLRKEEGKLNNVQEKKSSENINWWTKQSTDARKKADKILKSK